MQQRSGLDIEVVVGEPRVHRAEAGRLGAYGLGLYGSVDYLATHGTPASVQEVTGHGLVYWLVTGLIRGVRPAAPRAPRAHR